MQKSKIVQDIVKSSERKLDFDCNLLPGLKRPITKAINTLSNKPLGRIAKLYNRQRGNTTIVTVLIVN